MLIVPINIDHWWRGRGPRASALLVYKRHVKEAKLPYPQRCCLGHASIAAGDDPRPGVQVIAYAPKLFSFVTAQRGSSIRGLYNLNDTPNVDEDRRRQKIADMGKLVKIAFCFYVTNEDVD